MEEHCGKNFKLMLKNCANQRTFWEEVQDDAFVCVLVIGMIFFFRL